MRRPIRSQDPLRAHPYRRILMMIYAAVALSLAAGPGWTDDPSGERTLWAWTATQGMEAWAANGDIADITEQGGTVRFRTTGGDPILNLRSRFAVPATPWQAIELRLKSDRSGFFEIFWTDTDEGEYDGFSQARSLRIGVSGDGALRTYRAFPFWQNVGRIIKLRVDPFGGAKFELESIRIVETPTPEAATMTAGVLQIPVRTLSLQGVDGVPVPSGIRLRQRTPDGYGLAAVSTVDAFSMPYVTVKLTSTRVTRASLVFLTDRRNGLLEMPFAVQADGQPHLYNLDALSYPDWDGRILAMGIRPGSKEGGEIVLQGLSVGAAPQGPPDVRITSFDVAEALPRVGGTVRLIARITNVGGTKASNLAVAFTVNPKSGARILRSEPKRPSSLLFGQEEDIVCTASFARTGIYSVTARVVLPGGRTVSRTCRLTITPRPSVARTGYPPPPVPARGKIDVGVYYYPGWRTAGQWAPIARFPERRPVLGWYREGDPSVADWHIKWAVEHGITFFAYDWYWSDGGRSLEHALHDGFLKSRYRKELKFCLLWANHNPPNTSSKADLQAVCRYWIEQYFHQPEYYTIDGKPVVIIFSTHRFRSDMGSQAVREAFDDMRAECRKAGLPGLYLIACVGGDATEPATAAAEGYDAVTAYNWPGLGLKGGEREAPFADLLTPYAKEWQRTIDSGPLPLMTPILAGWDSRPWHGDTALVRSGRTPANFRKHLEDARQFIQTHPDRTLPVALIEAWNELGEGSYIEPHREYGFGWLDAIRSVFVGNSPHVDLTPADVGHRPPQVDVQAVTTGRWDLSRDGAGWDSGMNLAGFRVVEGGLQARSTGHDPAFFSPPMQFSAAGARRIRLRMKLTATDGSRRDDIAQVFWTTPTSAASEAASVRFPVHIDGEWHDYAVDVGDHVRWRGLISGLRFDPCNRSGIVVVLARMALEP